MSDNEYPDEYLDENGNEYQEEKPEQERGELRPCPFCGTLPQANAWIFRGISETRYFCPNQECPLSVRTVTLEQWNRRPIEDALNARIAELRDVIGDYRNDASRVLDEKCPSDERHCGCVPILRDQLNKYQKALILITTMPELSQATTIAREALQERGKFIWTEQSVGEYWVTKLDILQDKFDTLEKDYADVCQKRLEAADVFSRQIIELESENAELKADLKNKNARIAELEAHIAALEEAAEIEELGAQEAERKEFCPNCEAETPCTHEAELFVCDICGEDFAKYIVSRNFNVSDVSTTQDVLTSIKTSNSIENNNPDYYKDDVGKWIPVSERLPEGDAVLVYRERGKSNIDIDWTFIEGGREYWYNSGLDNVTHWMPLPKPPEVKE